MLGVLVVIFLMLMAFVFVFVELALRVLEQLGAKMAQFIFIP